MSYVNPGLGTEVARWVGEYPIMDSVAHEVLANAISNAVPHIDTSAYINSLEVKSTPGKKGVRDRLVIANDPAAISIEYGHSVRNEDAGVNEPNFTHVPGQYILTNAVAALPGSFYTSFGNLETGGD